MVAQRTVRVEITAIDTRIYLKYIGQDPDFHKACTTLHYDSIDNYYSKYCFRESDDTISFHFPHFCPQVKHSEGSYLVSLLPRGTRLFEGLFMFPYARVDTNPTEVSRFRFRDSFKYQKWRQAVTSAPLAKLSGGPRRRPRLASTKPPGPASSMMPPEPHQLLVLNPEPPPGVSMESAFAGLTSATHAPTTSFSSKLD